MFARAATYDVPPERLGEAHDAFDDAIARIRDCQGLVDAHLLLGTESGRVLTITYWQDHGAMTASRVAASRLRSEAATSVGGHVVTVEEYEVAEAR